MLAALVAGLELSCPAGELCLGEFGMDLIRWDRVVTGRTGQDADGMRRDSQRMASWDTSPRGLTNYTRLVLLELVELHEQASGNSTNGTTAMHRMIALQAMAEFEHRFPGDRLLPEVLLRRGALLRDAGLVDAAREAWYAAMRAAPAIKGASVPYQHAIVSLAQGSIADLEASLGHEREALQLYGRMTAGDGGVVDRNRVALRRIRLLARLKDHRGVVQETQRALADGKAMTAEDDAELRSLLALALLAQGDSAEGLRQVRIVMEAAGRSPDARAEGWRTLRTVLGNATANHLFLTGDYDTARRVYEGIASSGKGKAWAVPALEQSALCLERAGQRLLAADRLDEAARMARADGGAATDPALAMLADLAVFRAGTLRSIDALESRGLRETP